MGELFFFVLETKNLVAHFTYMYICSRHVWGKEENEKGVWLRYPIPSEAGVGMEYGQVKVR